MFLKNKYGSIQPEQSNSQIDIRVKKSQRENSNFENDGSIDNKNE